jgi:hypothetical protein
VIHGEPQPDSKDRAHQPTPSSLRFSLFNGHHAPGHLEPSEPNFADAHTAADTGVHMTSTQTQTQPQPETERTQHLQLSATQLIASALAAVTATVAASFLGVTGTVIGAAVASMLTVSGNAIYAHSLRRTSERVRTVVPTAVRRHAGAAPRPTDPTTVTPPEKPRKPLTRRQLAVAVVGLFAAVLALVTTVELAAGRPLSDLLRGKSGHGTTVFGTTHHSSNNHPKPTPTVTQTVRPTVVTTTPTVTQTAPASTTTAPSTAPPSSSAPPTTSSGTPTSPPAP